MTRTATMVTLFACLWLVAAMASTQASESEWAVNLILEDPTMGLYDGTTHFGIAGDANCDYNPGRDAPNPAPPPSGDYVDLYFYRPTWPGQSDWAQDWREPIGPGGSQTWEDIRATGTGDTYRRIVWTWAPDVWEPPAYYSFILYDEGDSPNPTGGTPYDMRTQSDMTFLPAGGGALRYFHITVTDTREPTTLTMSQPEYTSTYGEMMHVEATLTGGVLPLILGCLPGVRFEWDLDGDGEYDDLSADGVDNDCDGVYEADVLVDACAGTYSLRAAFDGDDVYQSSVSPPSVNEHHKQWIELLGEGALPVEEVPFTYSDPGSVIITAQDGSGSPLLHPEQLPEVRMEVYAYGGGYGLTKVFDKSSPQLALACTEGPCRTETAIDLEIQESGEVDLVPGEYYVIFTWPGDCHYHAAIADAALTVEPETLAPADCPLMPFHMTVDSLYCEEVTICAHRLDDDGEEICHVADYPVMAELSVWDPVVGAWDIIESVAGTPDTLVTFTHAAQDLWEAAAARIAADSSLQYRIIYSDSPYYATYEELGTWTVNATDKSSPMLAAGWNMIGVAGYPVDPDPASVFAGISIDGALYRYDAAAMSYVGYFAVDSGPFGEVQPGDGYWLYLDSPASFTYPGYCVSGKRVHCPLSGWYLIGNPLGDIVAVEQVSFAFGGQTLPLADAVAAGWVSNPLYMWDPVVGGYVTIGIDPWDLPYLPAFAGAWVQVNAMDMFIRIGDI